MVLAAGLGTRLRPLTERIAKPALPLLGSTLLEQNLALLARAGVREVVVNAHHLPGTVARAGREAAEKLGLKLHLSFEAPEILGTGGGLAAARPLLDRGEPFVLVNGDVLCDLEIQPAIEAHRASGAETTMVLRPMPEGATYGAVQVDEKGRVASIAGHGRDVSGERTTSWLFTGIHVLGPAIFEALPPSGESCVNRQGHAALIASGRHVHAHLDPSGRWSDVGTPERYAEANLDLLEGRYRLSRPLGAAVERSPNVFVDPTATIEAGAELLGPCWIGPGATVRAGSRVGPRAVLLAGSDVAGSIREAVAAPGAVVEGAVEGGLAG